MRQHVNPLSRFFQIAKELPAPNELFDNSDLPIHLDIGCARGKFLLEMASSNKNFNFLGLEIRESLVLAAEKERNDLEINNLKYLFCNVNVSLEGWLASLLSNQVKIVSIQFPDPWFKMRHRKRRVFNDSFVYLLAKYLDEGSKIFIQTDVFDLIQEMSVLLDSSNYFEDINNKSFLIDNPFEIYTEREIYAIKENLDIFRKIYYRNSIKLY